MRRLRPTRRARPLTATRLPAMPIQIVVQLMPPLSGASATGAGVMGWAAGGRAVSATPRGFCAASLASAERRSCLGAVSATPRSEEHTSELQSPDHLVCRLLLEKKKKNTHTSILKNKKKKKQKP